jgi:hypothetical protein
MTCYQDLEPIDYFPVDSTVMLYAVGWLGKESIDRICGKSYDRHPKTLKMLSATESAQLKIGRYIALN